MGTVNTTQERIELTAVDRASAIIGGVTGAVGNLRSSIDSVKGALAAVGVTVGAGAMLQLYNDVLKANAELYKMAQSGGTTAETLSKIYNVAKIGGHEFGGLSDQLARMIKGLKGADEDGQKAAQALGFLDIKAKDANGRFRDTGEIVIDLAKKLALYEDGGNKVAIVQDVLGKGAQVWLPLLKDLAAATDLHASVTNAQARAADQAEQNMRRLMKAMEDNRRELVNNYTPALNEWLEKLLKASRATGGPVSGASFLLMRPVGGPSPEEMSGADIEARIAEIDRKMAAHDAALEARRGRSGAANMLLDMTGQVGDTMSGYSIGRLMQEKAYLQQYRPPPGKPTALADWMEPGPLNQLSYATPKTGEHRGLSPFEQRALELRQQAAKEAMGGGEFVETQLAIQAGRYKTLDEATGKVRDLTEAEKQLLLQLAAARDTEKSYKEFREEKAKADEESAKAADERVKKLVAEREAYLDILDPAREYLHTQEALNEQVRLGYLTQDEAIKIQRKLFESKNSIKALGEEMDTTARAGHAMGLSFASSFDRLIFDSGRAVSALDILRAAAMDVAKVIYGRNVAEPLAAMTQRGISALFAGGSDAYASGSMTMESAWMLGEWFAGGGVMTPRGAMPLRRYAGGGIADSPQAAIFGEGSMNEAFVPLPDGRRIPVQMKGAGGGGHTFIIDARGADRTGLARLEGMISAVGGSIEYRAVNAVRRAAGTRGRSVPF